jgi:hypothetical protein
MTKPKINKKNRVATINKKRRAPHRDITRYDEAQIGRPGEPHRR